MWINLTPLTTNLSLKIPEICLYMGGYLCAFSAATATPEGTWYLHLSSSFCGMWSHSPSCCMTLSFFQWQDQSVHKAVLPLTSLPHLGASHIRLIQLLTTRITTFSSQEHYHCFQLASLFRLVMIILESYSCEQDAWFLASWILRGKMKLQCPAVIFF